MAEFDSLVSENLTELKTFLSNLPYMTQVLDPLPVKFSTKSAIYNTFHNNQNDGVMELLSLVDGSEPKVKEKFVERVKVLRPDLFTASASSSTTVVTIPSKPTVQTLTDLELYRPARVQSIINRLKNDDWMELRAKFLNYSNHPLSKETADAMISSSDLMRWMKNTNVSLLALVSYLREIERMDIASDVQKWMNE
eukprot:TRINITY_DN1295_c0_g2_i1.p1 TRINITY_DN1295_c0_g2~~TRINITY_DN1295_c0_g2_i1.p1  ORF type:complete len:216 (+),score=53.42 TRINITY_DN1295_c0_g2_i1:64-648(+)